MSEEKKTTSRPLAKYRLLGKSGLRVSPLCLGTMGFGETWKWMGETTQDECEKILDAYVAAGGNFIDTANKYQEGQAEEWIGQWMKKRGNRDELVLASKFSLPMKPQVINHAGNHRKNMFQSIEASLKRLQTSYLDIYYVHFWDYCTSVEEVMRGLNDLVTSGKVHYLGVSDTPAWIVAMANTLAEHRGWSQFTVYQGKYNVGQRDAERDILPMCRNLGIGFTPFGVLREGRYSGKFRRGQDTESGGRNGVKMSEDDYKIVDVILDIARETKRNPSQITLNWARQQPGVVSPLIGCRKLSHFEDNLGAMEFTLSQEQLHRLNAAVHFDLGFPHTWNGVVDHRKAPQCTWLNASGTIEFPH